MNWVHWWNNTRLYESLGYATPEELITNYNQHRARELTPYKKRNKTQYASAAAGDSGAGGFRDRGWVDPGSVARFFTPGW
ncbi:hypothetical protein [Mobiluncus mulieris]|uniref:hypothetical protein n=1 Tax=Mobiluncus mulieris TaxID=2052 RepID=UPI00242BBA0B|nr:hypothetical protein [Mobiluncus mulieris]